MEEVEEETEEEAGTAAMRWLHAAAGTAPSLDSFASACFASSFRGGTAETEAQVTRRASGVTPAAAVAERGRKGLRREERGEARPRAEAGRRADEGSPLASFLSVVPALGVALALVLAARRLAREALTRAERGRGEEEAEGEAVGGGAGASKGEGEGEEGGKGSD